MFKVAVGHSEDPDSIDAIKEILTQCDSILGQKTPNAGLLFGSPDYDFPAILSYLNERFPDLDLVGCTSSGELSSTAGYMEGSLVLTLFCSDKIKIHAGVVRDLSKRDPKENFQSTMEDVIGRSSDEPKLCMVFTDIFTIGPVQVVKEMEDVLGENVPIIGAGATDLQFKFTKTSEFYKTEVLQDSAPFLIFSGPLNYAIASSSGWEPFSQIKVIFDHKNNVISKIGDYTALDFYNFYLGGTPTLAYPLAIFQDKNDEKSFFLRAPISVDVEKGTVTVGADIPETKMACSIAKAEPERLLTIMRTLVSQVNSSQPIDCTFIASCACRQAVLGTKIKHETEVIHEAYSPEKPCFGMYAYGQIGPLETNGKNHVHNETVVVVGMGESEDG